MKCSHPALVLISALIGALPIATISAEPEGSGPGVKILTVEGEAVIDGADLPAARQRALQEAFAAALTQALGAYLTADSFTRNFESIDRGVYTRTEGYIKTYSVLKETDKDGLLQLQIEAQVSTEPLKDDLTALGILLDNAGDPLMGVEGSEEGLDAPVAPRKFEEELTRRGFQVQSSEVGSSDVLVRLSGRIQSANQIGGLGMYGAVVSLEATASWQPGGRTIGSVAESANGTGLAVEAALQDAYGKAADKTFPALLERVAAAWQAERSTGRLVPVEVHAADLADLTGFKRRLGRVFGVDKVDLKGFQPGRGELLVRFRGSAPQLAELIQMTEFQDHAVRITSVQNSALAVSVATRR